MNAACFKAGRRRDQKRSGEEFVTLGLSGRDRGSQTPPVNYTQQEFNVTDLFRGRDGYQLIRMPLTRPKPSYLPPLFVLSPMEAYCTPVCHFSL